MISTGKCHNCNGRGRGLDARPETSDYSDCRAAAGVITHSAASSTCSSLMASAPSRPAFASACRSNVNARRTPTPDSTVFSAIASNAVDVTTSSTAPGTRLRRISSNVSLSYASNGTTRGANRLRTRGHRSSDDGSVFTASTTARCGSVSSLILLLPRQACVMHIRQEGRGRGSAAGLVIHLHGHARRPRGLMRERGNAPHRVRPLLVFISRPPNVRTAQHTKTTATTAPNRKFLGFPAPRHDMDTTLLLVKPDAVRDDLTGAILHRVEQAGLSIDRLRTVTPTPGLIQRHYDEHVDEPYYSGLETYMTGGAVHAAQLSGTPPNGCRSCRARPTRRRRTRAQSAATSALTRCSRPTRRTGPWRTWSTRPTRTGWSASWPCGSTRRRPERIRVRTQRLSVSRWGGGRRRGRARAQ